MVSLPRLFASEPCEPPCQREGNDRVRSQLVQMGDDGAAPRPVTHYFFAKRFARRKATPQEITAYTATLGLSVHDTSRTLVVLTAEASVTGDDFDQLTEHLFAYGQSVGWVYDGWECAVVRRRAA